MNFSALANFFLRECAARWLYLCHDCCTIITCALIWFDLIWLRLRSCKLCNLLVLARFSKLKNTFWLASSPLRDCDIPHWLRELFEQNERGNEMEGVILSYFKSWSSSWLNYYHIISVNWLHSIGAKVPKRVGDREWFLFFHFAFQVLLLHSFSDSFSVFFCYYQRHSIAAQLITITSIK